MQMRTVYLWLTASGWPPCKKKKRPHSVDSCWCVERNPARIVHIASDASGMISLFVDLQVSSSLRLHGGSYLSDYARWTSESIMCWFESALCIDAEVIPKRLSWAIVKTKLKCRGIIFWIQYASTNSYNKVVAASMSWFSTTQYTEISKQLSVEQVVV